MVSGLIYLPFIDKIERLFEQYSLYVNVALFFLVTYFILEKFTKDMNIKKHKGKIIFLTSLIASSSYYSLSLAFTFLNSFEMFILILSILWLFFFVDYMFSFIIGTSTFLYISINGINKNIIFLLFYFNIFFGLLYKTVLKRNMERIFIISLNLKDLLLYFLKSLSVVIPIIIWHFLTPSSITLIYISFLLWALYSLLGIIDKVILYLIFNLFVEKNIEKKKELLSRRIENLKRFKQELEKEPYNNTETIQKVEKKIKEYEEMIKQLSHR